MGRPNPGQGSEWRSFPMDLEAFEARASVGQASPGHHRAKGQFSRRRRPSSWASSTTALPAMVMSIFFRLAQAALVTRPTVFTATLQGNGAAEAVSADSSIQSPVWSELPESIPAARNLRFSSLGFSATAAKGASNTIISFMPSLASGYIAVFENHGCQSRHMSITPPVPLYLDRDEDLPKQIFKEIKSVRSWAENNGKGKDLKSLYGRRGGLALERHDCYDLQWSVEMEFEQSILVWHLATEICYQLDYRREAVPGDLLTYLHDRGKCLSRYMLYLLIEHPNMLPIGTTQIKFRDLYSDLGNIIETYSSKPFKDVTEKDASAMLLAMYGKMLVEGGDMRNFTISHGCKLASQLSNKDQEQKWTIIVHVWIEILGHAASQCKGRQHAQQLRRGGEYLTHLWLLMAHFGLNDHFQIPRSRAVAEAVLR
ncbi:hypothetical protein C3L33_18332, partial [Rhododendron williamsianum]